MKIRYLFNKTGAILRVHKVKRFRIAIVGKKIPKAFPISGHLAQIGNHGDQNVVQKFQRLGFEQPFKILFQIERVLNEHDQVFFLRCKLLRKNIVSDVGTADRRYGEYGVINVSLCAVFIKIGRSYLSAVAYGVKIYLILSGIGFYFLNKVVQLFGVIFRAVAEIHCKIEDLRFGNIVVDSASDLFFAVEIVIEVILKLIPLRDFRIVRDRGDPVYALAVAVKCKHAQHFHSGLAQNRAELLCAAEGQHHRAGEKAREFLLYLIEQHIGKDIPAPYLLSEGPVFIFQKQRRRAVAWDDDHGIIVIIVVCRKCGRTDADKKKQRKENTQNFFHDNTSL